MRDAPCTTGQAQRRRAVILAERAQQRMLVIGAERIARADEGKAAIDLLDILVQVDFGP